MVPRNSNLLKFFPVFYNVLIQAHWSDERLLVPKCVRQSFFIVPNEKKDLTIQPLTVT